MAARFWVGGTGNWSDTTHWASTTGGAGSAGVPTSADDATIDANSGATATVTVDTAANANTITVNKADATLLHNAGSTVVGAMTVTLGTLNTNGQTCSWGSFADNGSGTSTTITLGASAISIGTTWSAGTSGTHVTFTANTATVTCTGKFQSGNSLNYNGLTLVFTVVGSAWIDGSCTLGALTRTGTISKTDALLLTSGITVTVTGAITLTGNSVVNRLRVSALTTGTRASIVCNGTVTATNCNFLDITASGSASWDLHAATGGAGDAGNNTGITFTAPQTNYFKFSGATVFSQTASWFLSTNGAGGPGRVPLPQDTGIFDANTGTATITIDIYYFGTVITSGWAGTLSFGSIQTNACGDLTIGATTTITGTQILFLAARGGQTVTSNGRTWTMAIQLANPGATATLGDDFTSSASAVGALTLPSTAGGFNDGGHNVTFTGASSSVTVAGGTLTMTGYWKIGGTAAASFWSATGGTVTATGSTIELSVASANARTFAGGGKTYGTLLYSVASSAGALVITGANTFATLDVEGSEKTLTLPSSTTTTVTSLFKMVGGTLNSSTPGVAATLSVAA